MHVFPLHGEDIHMHVITVGDWSPYATIYEIWIICRLIGTASDCQKKLQEIGFLTL